VRDSVCFSVEGEQYHFRNIPKYGKSHYPERLDKQMSYSRIPSSKPDLKDSFSNQYIFLLFFRKSGS
jgi:hypothetical protein